MDLLEPAIGQREVLCKIELGHPTSTDPKVGRQSSKPHASTHKSTRQPVTSFPGPRQSAGLLCSALHCM